MWKTEWHAHKQNNVLGERWQFELQVKKTKVGAKENGHIFILYFFFVWIK